MTSHFDVLIVGGGHAGAQAAIALRQNGFVGSLAIVTEESDPPYERPPLSKDYLAGEKPFERIMIRPLKFWQDKAITLLTTTKVVSIDPAGKTASDSNGQAYSFGDLIWAAGGHARKLSCAGGALAGVHSVRSRADVDLMIEEQPRAARVVIIGGGYIGLEAAAVLAKAGKHVTILEAQERVLARVAGEALSRFYEKSHRAHGVTILLNAAVDCLVGDDGRVKDVQLKDGTILPADMVIVGIGIVPAVEPLAAAGAVCPDGVDVDAYCRTSLPHIFAVGDCARHENAFAGARIRLESVQNATDQAMTVARFLTGQEVAYHAVPWFWSNQYDLKLQTIGLSRGYDATVVRGDPETQSFSIVYLSKGRVIALDCVNLLRDFVQGKALVVNCVEPDLTALADTQIPLKSLVDTSQVDGVVV